MISVFVKYKQRTHALFFCELCTLGGERGIRTPETGEGLLAFQASALDHYATSPSRVNNVKIQEILSWENAGKYGSNMLQIAQPLYH